MSLWLKGRPALPLFLTWVAAATLFIASEQNHLLWTLDPNKGLENMAYAMLHVIAHQDLAHAGLNALGLAALYWLWPQAIRLSAWRVFALVAATSGATLLLAGSPVWGASGLVHALYAYCALAHGFPDRNGHPRHRLVLTAGLLLKVVLEAAGLAGPGIAWAAHLAGVLAGAGLVLFERALKGRAAQLP